MCPIASFFAMQKPLDGVPHVQGSSGCGPQGGSTACAPLEGLSGLQWSSVQCAGQPHCSEGSPTHGGPHVQKKVFIPHIGWVLQVGMCMGSLVE